MDLAQKQCVPCKGDIPPFNKDQINEYLTYLNNWETNLNEDRFYFLVKKYKFSNFEKSLDFVNKVSTIAESENHHPDIKFGWGYVEIIIFTHAIKGLSESDFVLAAKIDEISV
jgi:4a-hydroxytetrahydrobiopterin dehydratase